MAALIAYMMIAGMIIYFISRKGRPFSSQPGRALPDASQRKKSGLQEGLRFLHQVCKNAACLVRRC